MVDTPVSLTALAPTILELVGIDLAAYEFQVESFARLLDGEPPESFAGPFAEVDFVPFSSGKWVREVHKKSVVSERYKVVRDDTTGLVEIYDLLEDPAESRNLAPERPELAGRLLALLEQRIAESRSTGLSLDEPALEQEQVEKLRSLGYVGQ
jgi:arylsulfatase A-like enzyme